MRPAPLALGLALLAWAGVVHAADGLFDGPYRCFPVAAPAHAVALADFNGDGRLDIVTGNGVPGPTYSVLLGNSQGSFDPAASVTSRTTAVQAVAVGDLDRDGRADLAFATADDSCLVVLGNGDGSFRTPRTYATGDGPGGIAIAKLNADNYPDLVVSNVDAKTISVLIGDGTGGFSAATNYPTAGYASSVALADVNLDGLADLVNTNRDSASVSVRLGNGDGSFGPRVSYATAPNPRGVAIGRIDHDTRPDLVVAGSSTSMTVLFGLSGGGFSRTDVPAGSSLERVRLADLDLDGDLDVALVTLSDDRLVTVLSRGNGTFDPPTERFGASWDLAIGDADGDFVPDVVSVAVGPVVSVFHGNRNGRFGVERSFATSAAPIRAAAGDFNHNQHVDLAVAAATADSVTVLLGLGDGTFGTRVSMAVGDGPRWIAVGDFDGNGNADVAALNTNVSKLSVLLGNGNGTFAPRVHYVLPFADHLVVRDLNGDGRSDVLTTNGTGGTLSVLIAQPGGTLAPAVDYPAPWFPVQSVLCDLDQDGRLDIVCCNFNNTWGLSVWPGLGNGTFGARTDLDVGDIATAIAAGDADQDGHVDLALVQYDVVQILYGRGNGTFSHATYWASGLEPHTPYLGDVNGDGTTDLVTGGYEAVAVTASIRLGPGAAPTTYYGTGGVSMAPLAVDVNQDGRADLVMPLNESMDRVSVLLQRAFAQATGVTARSPRSVLWAPQPNPAREGVAFGFELAAGARVGVRVCDVNGRIVHRDPPVWTDAGSHELRWNGRSDSGDSVPPGVYFVELSAGDERMHRAFTVLH